MTSGNLKRKQQQQQLEQYQKSDNLYLDSELNNDINKKLKMNPSKTILMAFHLVTCGLQGNDLGRDETAILQVGFQLIDLSNNQAIGGKLILLQASSLLDPSANPDKIHISVPAREMTDLLSSPSSHSTFKLQDALNEIDSFINQNVLVSDDQTIEVIPVILGHLPLRSVLHRETRFRNINLNNYWYHYYNLFDEVSIFTSSKCQNLDEISNFLQIEKPGGTTMSIICYMSNAILQLTQLGHLFHSKHVIKNGYKPIVFHVNDEIEPDIVLMIKPIDYKTPINQIIPFFRGLNIADGGIAVIMSEGRRSNKILIKFEDKIQRDIALLRDKHHMEPGNSRFITISVHDSREFMKIAGYENESVKVYLEQIETQDQILIRIKGLPYTVTKPEILNFFKSNDVEVQFSHNGIFLVQKSSGELNGDAFVIFENEGVAQKAKNLKGMTIGNRYMEIFYSTTPEMNQVISAAQNIPFKPKQNKQITKPTDSVNQENIKSSQKAVMSGTVTKYIPMEASDNDFVRYLADHRGLCLLSSRSHLYSPIGYISYVAFFKNSSDASATIKALRDKPFKVESSNKEVTVETVELPLVSKLEERPAMYSQVLHNMYPNSLPVNYVASLQNMLPYHSVQMPQPMNISNPLNFPFLNVPMLNYNVLPNVFLANQQINPIPDQNLLMPFQIPITMSLNSTPNLKLLPPSNMFTNPFNQQNALADYRQAASVSSSVLNRSKILFMSGMPYKFTQSDLDSIFHSIVSHISMAPKLLQHNQNCYAVFNSVEDANIALQRCPIILFNSQLIHLIPTHE